MGSQTKEVSFVFSLGHGSKQTETENPIMMFPTINHEHHLESKCRIEVNEGKWEEIRGNQLYEKEKNYRKIIQERGVRATLIDRDNKPKWKPPSLDLVNQEKIDHYF